MTGTTTAEHRRSRTDRAARGHTRGLEWTVAALELVVAVNGLVAGIASWRTRRRRWACVLT